jgi:hypothetical protein
LLTPALGTSWARHRLVEEWRIVIFGGMSALLDRFAVDRVDIDR